MSASEKNRSVQGTRAVRDRVEQLGQFTGGRPPRGDDQNPSSELEDYSDFGGRVPTPTVAKNVKGGR